MMNIDTILHEIADTLRGFNWMRDIPVIVEEKNDPDNMTEMEIAQQRAARRAELRRARFWYNIPQGGYTSEKHSKVAVSSQ